MPYELAGFAAEVEVRELNRAEVDRRRQLRVGPLGVYVAPTFLKTSRPSTVRKDGDGAKAALHVLADLPEESIERCHAVKLEAIASVQDWCSLREDLLVGVDQRVFSRNGNPFSLLLILVLTTALGVALVIPRSHLGVVVVVQTLVKRISAALRLGTSLLEFEPLRSRKSKLIDHGSHLRRKLLQHASIRHGVS